MLSPTTAWRALCKRTGGSIARVTFYRWVRTGKVFSIRLGQRIFIPQAALEDVIRQCLTGERF
jgi:Helix-turn-helix domain